MSCECKELKVNQKPIKIYEKLARQNIQTKASVSITQNILQLARITNSKDGEVEVIIKPLVDVVAQTRSYSTRFCRSDCQVKFRE